VTLASRVIGTAVGVLCVCLFAVGAATGVLLHLRAQHSLDQALLAAAYAEAHPWQEQRFVNDQVPSPVTVRPWTPDDPRVSQAMYDAARSAALPQWATVNGYRVLLLVTEPEGGSAPGAPDREQLFVVSEAPAVTAADTILPFGGVYLLVSLVALGLAALAIRVGMQRALRPLGQAADALEAVEGLESGARLGAADVPEVDQLIDSANRLLERLERAFDAQAGFTAQAAHELRTPVTVMKGEVELALRRPRSAEDYQLALRRTLDQVQHLADLVEGLMALTRVEAGHADRGRRVEHLSMAVLQACRQEQQRLERAECAIHPDLSNDPEIRAHHGLLATALGNLLRNVAVHAPGASVWLHVEVEDACVRVIVDDDGPGVPAEFRDAMMERFHHRGERGLGLGLSLAREVARRHGGDLSLQASPRGGLRAVMRVSTRG
jgi:signal transduction histidine kinase